MRVRNWGDLPERFGVGAGELFNALEDAMLEPDHHIWTRSVGDRVRRSANSVWETLAAEWCRTCLDATDRQRVVAAIAEALAAGTT